MTLPEPIPLHVVRWRCTFCPRSRSTKAATVEHIGRCWLNPAVRGCKTCAHYSMPAGCCGGYDCNCPPEVEQCAAGLDLTAGLRTVFILLCALSGSVLGVTALLGILDMIGRTK